jgi:hypothetical protein
MLNNNMNSSDEKNLAQAYLKIVKEDLGLGPNAISNNGMNSTQGAITIATGGNQLPDGSNPVDNETTEMAEAQVKSAIEDANQILNDLNNSGKVEAWVLTKLATVADRLQSVRKYLDHNR